MFEPKHRRAGSLSSPAGIGIIDESSFEDWFDDITERMMNDAVAEWRRFYDALFGIRNDELSVAAVSVGFARQFGAQRKQVLLQMVAELQNRTAVAFANTRVTIGILKIFKIDDGVKKFHTTRF